MTLEKPKTKRKCWNCKGKGVVVVKMQNVGLPCLLCNGSGSITDDDDVNIIRGRAKTEKTGRGGNYRWKY